MVVAMPMQHQHRHADEAQAPGRGGGEAEQFEQRDQIEHADGRSEHADAIGGDIGRHAGGLFVLVEAFDPERIDDDILRRRRGRDQQRAECDMPRRHSGIQEGEEHDRRHQQELREHQPAAAPSQHSRQNRDVDGVDDRRPQEFQRVGRADQREEADGLEVDAGGRAPHLQGRAGQRERQPGREAEEHHDQHARAQIDRDAVEKRAGGRWGGIGCGGHGPL